VHILLVHALGQAGVITAFSVRCARQTPPTIQDYVYTWLVVNVKFISL
jgi:hypothetical protein